MNSPGSARSNADKRMADDQQQEVKIVITAKNLSKEAFAEARKQLLGLTTASRDAGEQSRKTRPLFQSLDSSLTSAAGSAGLLTKGLAGIVGAVSIGAVAGVVKSFIGIASEIKNASAQADIGTTEFQILKFAGRDVGVEITQITDALTQFNIRLGKRDSGAIGAVQALGFNVKDLLAMEPAQRFKLVGQAVDAITDPTIRSAYAVELFGKQGPKILEVAKNYDSAKAAADRLHAILDPHEIEVLDRAGNAWDRLGHTIKVWGAEATVFAIDTPSQIKKSLTDAADGTSYLARAWEFLHHPTLAQALAFAQTTSAANDLTAANQALAPAIDQTTAASQAALTPADLLRNRLAGFRADIEELRAKAIVPLTKDQSELIRSALALGVSVTDIAQKTGLAEPAIQALADAHNRSKQEAEAHRKKLAELSKEFAGIKSQREAADVIEAVTFANKSGLSIAKMTKEAQEQIVTVLNREIERYQRLGEVAPAALRRTRDAAIDAAQAHRNLALGSGVPGLLPMPGVTLNRLENPLFGGAMSGSERAARDAFLTSLPVGTGGPFGGSMFSASFFNSLKKFDVSNRLTPTTDHVPLPMLGGMTLAQWKEISEGRPRFGGSGTGFLKGAFGGASGFGGLIGSTALSAITGGGNPFSAIAGSVGSALTGQLAKVLTSGAGTAISGVMGGALNAVLPGIGALAGPLLGKLFGGLFGKSEDRKRTEAATAKIGELQSQLVQQLGGQQNLAGFEKLFGGITHTFGNKGEQGLKNVTADLEAFTKKVDSLKSAAPQIQQMVADASRFGQGLPERFQPFLDQMRQLGLLQEDQGFQWQQLQSDAERYGIDLGALGPKFQGARLKDTAKDILTVFEEMKANAADVGGVLVGMREEISALVNDSLKFGTTIPENMRPMIEDLARSGNLLDANGQKMTDISGIQFGEPIKVGLEAVVDRLDKLLIGLGIQLPEAFAKGVDGAVDQARRLADNVIDATNRIPRSIPIHVYEEGGVTGRSYTPADIEVRGAAAGGLFSKPTLRVVAERQPEVVGSPNLIVESFARALEQRERATSPAQSVSSRPQMVTVQLVVGEEVLGDVVVDIARRAMREGRIRVPERVVGRRIA